ncbi:MmcQ/YjbR family DNA-binding protein [Enterocloster sp.]|uniref:MmcQ/YjbR family DNA-binding protein n=1 Tax=Enterocloster sp. TaxID=2719315 RepID=UPI0039951B71
MFLKKDGGAVFWRNAYEAVVPAYHQNKEHWNSVILDGSVSDEVVKRMVAESYDLVKGRR